MKKLFELPEADFMKLQVGDHQTLNELGKEYGFKPETVEFTGGGTTQFFAEKLVKELEPITIGDMDPDTFTAVQLAKFSYKVADLQKKADEYSKLEVKDVNDKEGLKILSRARIELKGDVAGIRKAGKQLREFSNSYNKAVIAREDELASIIEPVRDALQKRENEIEEEKERIRLEAERIEDLRIQGMIDKLAAVGHAADYSQIKATDEAFEELLTEAINIHNEKVKRDQEEADALRLQKEKEERERKEEAERLEKQRLAQEEENKKIAAQQAQIREQQETLRKQQQEIEEAKQKLFNEKIQGRKNALNDIGFVYSDVQRSFRFCTPDVKEVISTPLVDVEKFDDDAFARCLSEAQEFIIAANKKYQEREIQFQAEQEKKIKADQEAAVQKALKEKEEKERKAKELAEEKAASDHDKLLKLFDDLQSFPMPECKSKNGKFLVETARASLFYTASELKRNMFNEGSEVL